MLYVTTKKNIDTDFWWTSKQENRRKQNKLKDRGPDSEDNKERIWQLSELAMCITVADPRH